MVRASATVGDGIPDKKKYGGTTGTFISYVVFEREAREFLIISHFHVSTTSKEYHSHRLLMPRRKYDENSDTNARTQVQYVPCSGLLGHNITTSHKESKLEWYKGPTLTEAIDSLDTRKRFDDSPPRLFVSDVYPHKKDLIRVYGKIAAGSIGVKDRVLLMPLNLRCTSTCSRINTRFAH